MATHFVGLPLTRNVIYTANPVPLRGMKEPEWWEKHLGHCRLRVWSRIGGIWALFSATVGQEQEGAHEVLSVVLQRRNTGTCRFKNVFFGGF